MSSELKPCPFCGTKDCLDCPLEFEGTVDQWNTRPIESALRARVEELERRNAELVDAAYIDVESGRDAAFFDLTPTELAAAQKRAQEQDGTGQREVTPDNGCGCRACRNKRGDDNPFSASVGGMILCSICGNKRCPHATDHRLTCTNSNDPGQAGSIYAQREVTP